MYQPLELLEPIIAISFEVASPLSLIITIPGGRAVVIHHVDVTMPVKLVRCINWIVESFLAFRLFRMSSTTSGDHCLFLRPPVPRYVRTASIVPECVSLVGSVQLNLQFAKLASNDSGLDLA